MTSQPSTLHDVLVRGRSQLVAAGVMASAAEVDVDVLARHILQWDRATLLVRRREQAPDGLEAALAPLLARRATHEPVAYITGHREFWGLDFEVSSDVLVPRPETESVVEEALIVLRGLRAPGSGLQEGPEGRVAKAESREPRAGTVAPGARSLEPGASCVPHVLDLDLGTGSGCLAIAIAASIADAFVVATDVSIPALRVARRNALKLGADRVSFVAGDWLTPIRSEPWVDVLVSNPPYVPRAARNLMPDVERHEPAVALFGGPDGLAHLRRLVVDTARVVRPGGWLIFEFGDGQEDAVRGVFGASSDWSIERVRDDLQGIARVIVARRRA